MFSAKHIISSAVLCAQGLVLGNFFFIGELSLQFLQTFCIYNELGLCVLCLLFIKF